MISRESLGASRWARQAHSGGQSPHDVLCETGMQAACGLLEKTSGIASCFLYYDIFLSKPALSPQFILHEHYPIEAGFEEEYLKWWAWLWCRASGPKPSSSSHVPLAPQHESGLTGPLKRWLRPSHNSSHQSYDACLVLHLSPPRPVFNTRTAYATWIQECLAAWPCWRDSMAWDGEQCTQAAKAPSF